MPEPPGGLIPYRSGSLWGYSDTTGQVVINPVFEQQPEFFIFGFGQVREPAAQNIQGRLLPGSNRFVNARGETLKGDPTHAVMLLPDSSLQLVERRAHFMQPEVTRFYRQEFGPGGIATVLLGPPTSRYRQLVPLGSGRLLGYQRQHLPPKVAVLAPQLLRGALLDAQEHRLTGFRYARIYPFQQGFARFERTRGGLYTPWGLLNRAGRELLHGYGSIEGPYHNRILANRYDPATTITYGTIFDTTGHVVSAVQPRVLAWLVPGQLIACYANGGTGEGHLLSADGTPLLNGQLFRQFTPVAAGRILVECLDGQSGLVAGNGRWVVPCQPQRLLRLSSRFGVGAKDTTAIQVVRDGKKGILAVSDGLLLVPPRYDELYAEYYEGTFRAAGRAGRQYIVNRSGQELLEARPADEYYERDPRRHSATPPLLAVVKPDNTIGLLDSAGQLHSAWYPYVPPANLRTRGLFFEDLRHPLPLPPNDQSFTRIAKDWATNGSLLINRWGAVYSAPPGTTWMPGMRVGENYRAAPFELGVYPVSKGFVTKGGTLLWSH